MKFYKFKKLGILGTIFLLCTTCFLSGRISVANADGSNAVLPVAKGGTGANSASEASTNILGTNFANYSDKLPASQLTGSVPIANGGTGANTASQAITNLGLLKTYKYDDGSNWETLTAFKIMDGVYRNELRFQTVEVSGLSGVVELPQKKFIISAQTREYSSPSFYIYQLAGDCSSETPVGFYTLNGLNFSLYLNAALYTSTASITWTAYRIEPAFTPAKIPLASKPSGAIDIYTKCASYS